MNESKTNLKEAKEKIRKYRETGEIENLLHANGKCWIAFKELIVDKTDLNRNKFIHDTTIKRHASNLGLINLYERAHIFHKVYCHAGTCDPRDTIHEINSFIKEIKKVV